MYLLEEKIMGKPLKIIKSSGNYSESNLSDDEYDNEYMDFEKWEARAELLEEGDYPGLVKYCERRAKRFPDDPYSQFYLGEAYVLNKEYEKAIVFIAEHHRKRPGIDDFKHVILDALFAQGKNENDFVWTEKPVILRMSDKILDYCYNFLKPKIKPRYINTLYLEFITKGYLLFSEEELLKGLIEDERFIVNDVDEGVFAKVQVARGKK
ncbi:MAG: hypothetical protein PHH77_10850 [Victivallaceae bacterium]|nr:hypothetical protein [Victivallaceae bacterium]